MTKTKKCPKCGERKRRAQFSRDRSKGDGLQSRCKACQAAHRATPESRERHRRYCAKFKATHPDRLAEHARRAVAKHNAKYPKRAKARAAAYYHVPLAGNCESCGAFTALSRHHPDYDQPLDIMTVCRQCHLDIHQAEKEIA